jgi:hypothetical protein
VALERDTMTMACNSAGGERKFRQAIGGGGNCVICVREKPGGFVLDVFKSLKGCHATAKASGLIFLFS